MADREREPRRHDPDDGGLDAAKWDRASDDRWIGAESPAPCIVAKDDDGRGLLLLVGG